MPLLAQKQIGNVTLSAIEEQDRVYVEVTINNPCRSMHSLSVDKPMSTPESAVDMVNKANGEVAEREKQELRDLCGLFVGRLNWALNAPIGQINAQIMRFDRKV